MKAAIFHGSGKPLEVTEVPTPEAGSGQILVKVAACGVCHTDLHYIDHGVPTFKEPPMILGHEPSGTVAGVGSDVSNFKEGDKVLLPAVLTCGYCPNCRLGKENICDNMVMFGNHVDGAYAEYVLAPAKDALHMPDDVPLEEGSIIADAISTPYHAVVNRGEVKAGDNVVVFGCGGVGINTVQVAAAVGASVIAVDIIPEKLEMAKKLGAQSVIDASKVERIDKEVKKMTGGGADVSFEVIGNPKTIQDAFACIRKGGRTVVVGYTHKNVELPASKIMFFEQEIIGSLGCRPVDYPKIIEMARTGKIKLKELVTGKFPLEKINDAFDLLRKNDPNALRSIITP
ncbi:alcohol dehydrogenase [candidate division LCP-89 bacterium B3_LCP]|uniref:Alcohol dehydrogenase n=1 Tax=candidate division LCP-89 bacterium B3_LCP TaxID=2012998 RepID=A0A532UYT3_UNCL8|nr:MAG: alcohol dehydrogenase [candidate division LCP-89 bacterium B3_LCP]